MKALVISNATVDESYAVDALPRAGESSVGALRLRDIGGKGANVAVVMARCGLTTTLVASVGEDSRATFIREQLMNESLNLDLMTLPNGATDVSLIYVTPDGENSIVTTLAAAWSLDGSLARDVLATGRKGDYLILQGNLSSTLTRQLIVDAQSLGLLVIMNPSPLMSWQTSLLPMTDVVFVNAIEAQALTGLHGAQAVLQLLNSGPSYVVVTQGGDDILFGARIGAKGVAIEPRVEAIATVSANVIDTTGAGDTFLAVAIASSANREVMLDKRALEDAAAATAITIGHHGTLRAFPTMDQLDTILAR